MSIQLQLGGHSFSCDTLPHTADEEALVEVELLTAKTVAVPFECFQHELAEKYLQLSGMECSESEVPVWSHETDGVVAVMAIAGDIADMLAQRYGSRLEYTSPLLRNITHEGRYLYIYSAEGVAYFKLYDGTMLKFCEVLPATGNDDILCIVERIISEFNPEGLVIGVAAVKGADSLINLVKQYHKVEICE